MPIPVTGGGGASSVAAGDITDVGVVGEPLIQVDTAAAGFALLTPTTTRGDIIVRGASADQRLALGTVGKAFVSDGTDGVWSLIARPPVHIPLGVEPISGTVNGTQGTVSVGGVPGALTVTDYDIPGMSVTWTLRLTAQVTSGDTLTVVLRNITDSSDAATIAVTATTPTNYSAAATILTNKVYALHETVSGGTISNIGTVYNATLRAAWS